MCFGGVVDWATVPLVRVLCLWYIDELSGSWLQEFNDLNEIKMFEFELKFLLLKITYSSEFLDFLLILFTFVGN